MQAYDVCACCLRKDRVARGGETTEPHGTVCRCVVQDLIPSHPPHHVVHLALEAQVLFCVN